jgi:RimJ/RimL family protein N-acetyltransferase
MLRKEYHGKGYATEFVKAFLEAYWALPRVRTQVAVDEQTVELNEGSTDARECLGATTSADNKLSHSVLQKTGFEHVKAYMVPANNPQGEDDMMTLWAWTLKYPLNAT